MAETTFNVYDLVYPSPLTLKEISSMAVGLDLWRFELNKYRLNETVNKFCPEQGILIKSLIPDLPLTLYYDIEKHLNNFGSSITRWLSDHFFGAFLFHFKNFHDILNTFDDFVCDHDGTVHYIRTARRMLLCDRFCEEDRFRIACMYCFEDDIVRLWPSVSNKFVKFDESDFHTFPTLYYWICKLRNESDRMPNPHDEPIDEMMLDHCQYQLWPSVPYFWNRLSPESQDRKIVDICKRHKELFVRSILAKLNDQQLGRFVETKGDKLIVDFLMDGECTVYVLPTWTRIRNKISESSFTHMVEAILKTETNHFIAEDVLKSKRSEIKDKSFSTIRKTYLCCKVWEYTPRNLKRFAIRNILSQSNEALFQKQFVIPSEPREIRFLLTMLSDATLEDRNLFWLKNWQNLIVNARVVDLHRIMKICFENDIEVAKFKSEIMAQYENISPYCVELLENGFFKELGIFLNFCCSNTPTRKMLKRQLLRSNFFGEESVLNVMHFGRIKSMSDFIDSAFESHILAFDFKHQLALLPVTNRCLFQCIRYGHFPSAMNFVNTFVRQERIVIQLKERFVEALRENLIKGFVSNIRVVYLQEFLVWCLKKDHIVTKFRNSLPVHEIFQNMVEKEKSSARLRNAAMRYPLNLDQFLLWYFDTPEEIGEFKKQYHDVFQMFVLDPKRKK